jgi:hypothetical protein
VGWDEQAAWAEERGLWLRDVHWCPRVVFERKSCVRYVLGEKSREAGKRCVCEDPAITLLADHCRAWRNYEVGNVLTTEPYNATEENIAAFREVVEGLGLVLWVTKGVWSDGIPMLIVTNTDVMAEMLKL